MVENPEAQTVANEEEEQEAIESYFLAGYEYETILCFLSKYHGINHSMSTLKRRLREYGLKRKNAVDIDDNDIVEAIQQELQGPSCVSGYRSMWHTLQLKYGLYVPRDKVQRILKSLTQTAPKNESSTGLRGGHIDRMAQMNVGTSMVMIN
jgi:hypothetical protein